MINKRMMKSAVIITVAMLSLGGCAGGCSKQEQPVSAEATVSEEESTEESLESVEPTPSPTVTPTTEPAEESSSSEESLDSSENEVDTAEEQEEDLGYEIISIDDTIMYATQNCNLRSGPSTDYEKVGSLSYAQEITVNGKVETEDGKVWWVLKSDTEEKQMVSGGLVSETKPVQQTTQPSTDGGSGTTQQPSGGETQQPSGGGSQPSGGSSQPADDGFDPNWGGLGEMGNGGLIQDSGHNWNVE